MKRVQLFLMAFVAVLCVGLVSCNKDDDKNSTAGGNGSGTGMSTTDDWVDLGLPSGLLWATRNIGASSPEGYGDYFSWGDTQPKSDYGWGNYRYANGGHCELTKYCSNSYFGYNDFSDDLTLLLPEDDAATANWGDSWRTPTKDEWQELLDNTTSTWFTLNGVSGRLFTASNGNNLFLPAAGSVASSQPDDVGWEAYYWSASLDVDAPYNAWIFSFYGNGQSIDRDTRHTGESVRAVRSAN